MFRNWIQNWFFLDLATGVTLLDPDRLFGKDRIVSLRATLACRFEAAAKVIICKYDSTFILVQVVVPISAARTCISIATSADSQDILRIFIFRPDGPLVIQPDCLHTHYDFDQDAQLHAYLSLWRRGRVAAPCACVVPRRGGYSLNIATRHIPRTNPLCNTKKLVMSPLLITHTQKKEF